LLGSRAIVQDLLGDAPGDGKERSLGFGATIFQLGLQDGLFSTNVPYHQSPLNSITAHTIPKTVDMGHL
jgi:hypothetical protein